MLAFEIKCFLRVGITSFLFNSISVIVLMVLNFSRITWAHLQTPNIDLQVCNCQKVLCGFWPLNILSTVRRCYLVAPCFGLGVNDSLSITDILITCSSTIFSFYKNWDRCFHTQIYNRLNAKWVSLKVCFKKITKFSLFSFF